jgi:hypothetical protein
MNDIQYATSAFHEEENTSTHYSPLQKFPLLSLPSDIILEISDHLDDKSLSRLTRSSRNLNLILFSSALLRLLEHPCLIPFKQLMSAKDAALARVAVDGATRAVNYFLAVGSKVFGDKRWDCLREVVRGGHVATVRALIDSGANLKISSGRYEYTPLHIAVYLGGTDMIILLLGHGASPNTHDSLGETPLHVAARKGFATATSLLLTHGASINERDMYGKTALYKAAVLGYTEIVSLLLTHGAYVDVKENRGMTALHEVAWRRTTSMFDYLIQHGASVSIQDNCGRNPMQVSHYSGALVKMYG